MKIYKDLTIFFVSFFSKPNIDKLIKRIDPKIKILIIDNAQEKGFKNYFEKKYKNVKVIVSKSNKGESGGINIGFKHIKTKYALKMDSDVIFKKSVIDKFIQTANNVKDFVILAPQHEKSFYKSDFISKQKSIFKNLQLMKLVHGQFMFFKMKNVKKVGYFDENFFLYFEETDFCFRAYKRKQKIYVLTDTNVIHKGGWSVNLNNKLEIEANKHWHFMWSKFYYYKKNYSLFVAYQKTLIDFFESLIKYAFFFFFDHRKRIIFYNKISGLVNSIIGNKPFKRISN